jgi:mycothiol synthase
VRPEEDVWLVISSGGELAGYGFIYQEDPPSVFVAEHVVHPAHEGRGIDALLLDLSEYRAMAAAASPPVTATLGVWAHERHASRTALYEDRDYRHVRTFLRLQVELDRPPAAPVWPPGITVRGFRRHGDEAAVHAAADEAFRDHWRPDRMDYSEWLAFRFEHPDLDCGLWWVAWDGGEVAGTLLAFATPLGGYIDELAVRRPWRCRGVGRALLLEAFTVFHRRGLAAAYLGVDSLNPTGAVHLYSSLGMEPVRGARLVFEKVLPAT